ncbi:MAG: hypothetical protein K5886_04735 [Lachnospiraceae bacterium]|nr:hypothetical protein [Lachnospiraceae bacterium]
MNNALWFKNLNQRLKPVPWISVKIEIASGEDVEKNRGELQASGFILDLDEITVCPAKQE